MERSEFEVKPLGFSNEPEYTDLEKQERCRKRKLLDKPPKAKKAKKPSRLGNMAWCHCNKCIPMSTERQSTCCMEGEWSSNGDENPFGRRKCVTQEGHFESAILDSETLKIAWVQHDMLRCAKKINANLTK